MMQIITVAIVRIMDMIIYYIMAKMEIIKIKTMNFEIIKIIGHQ